MNDQAATGTQPSAEVAALRQRVAELEELEAERVRAEQVQAALYRITDAASAVEDMQEFYAVMHRIVGELMYARNFFIGLYDQVSGLISFPYYVDEIDLPLQPPQKLQRGGLTAYVIRTGLPYHDTPDFDELVRRGEVDLIGSVSVDGLWVPLKTEGRTLGALAVQSYTEGITYSNQDLELLVFVGQHIATALSRARAIEETRQRNAELALVNEIEQALAAQLDFHGIIELVGERVRAIFDASNIFIALYDRQTNLIRFPYYIARGERIAVESRELGGGLTSVVIQSGQPLMLHTWAQQLQLGVISDPADIEQSPTESWLGVPIISGDDVIGVVSVHRLEQHAFSESDVSLLSTLASSMAVALENARLFEETRRLLAETEQRAAELAIVNEVGQALAQQLDFQAIIDLVGERVRAIFDTTDIFIVLYERQTNLIRFPYYIDHGERYVLDPYELGPGLTSIAIRSRQPLLFGTSAEMLELGAILTPAELEQPNESQIVVPLIAGDEVIGVVSVMCLEQHAFSEADVRLLSTLAASMAVALENARLFDETKHLLAETEQRAAELATINTVSQALAAELELDALITLTGEQVRQTFAADIAYVGLHDRETGMIHFPYEFGDTLDSIRYGEGLSSRIIATGEPLLINEAVQERHAEFGTVPVGIQAKSYVGVPIMVGKQAIGVLSVQSTQQEGRFGETDVRLLATIAANVGAAIENARLYSEAQRRAREMAALAEVGREISASLDLPTVLERIAARAQELLHGRDVVLRLLEPDGNLPAVVALGKYAEIYKAWQVRLGYGLTGNIAQSGVAEVINDPLDDPRVAHIAGTEADDQTEAMVFAPLIARERVIGVMTVWRDKTVSGPFAQSDLDFVIGLARQAAIAIENARLFAEIQQQKEFSEALIDASPVAIILADMNSHITSWNPAAETLFGYTRAEAMGRHLDDLVANRPDIRQDADRYTPATSATYQGTGHHGIGRRTRKDGQLVDVEFFSVAISMGGQDVTGFTIYHDITELNQARQEAIAANEAKSAFLANMSHELRTPLNAIIGFSRIVRRKAAGALPDKQLDNLDKVLVSADQLLGLINTILDIAKIEAGRMDVQLASFSPAGLVDACVTTAQPLLRPGVALLKDVAADLPPVYSDQAKVRQILLNLLSNAAKFTHAGTITLRATTDHRPLTTDRLDAPSVVGRRSSVVAFEVTDTGIGISEEALGRIFEEFQQADTSTTRQYGGTGLGLAISRHLARLLGGDLVATSTPGNGSTFTLTIPMRYGEPPARAETIRVDTAPLALSAEKPIVLAIDDDPDAIEILQDNLAEAGYQVVGARGGAEGVQKAKELHPYAITLDIMMPDKDGWQVLHELKNDPATRDIPIILLTIVDKKALGYQLGAADYLVKPLDREALLAALERMAHANGGIAPKRLLVVDDDPNVIEMVQQLLGETHYELDSAADGLAALETIARRRPDIIMLDLMMPQLDGFGVIERLRQRPDYASIPIVVLTAKTLTSTESERLRESVSRIIQKQGLEGDTLIRELQRATTPIAAEQ